MVKFGRQVNLAEGENMVFVAHTTSVPVPFVYALFKDPRDDKGYIIRYSAAPANYSRYLPIVQKMMDSFNIIK